MDALKGPSLDDRAAGDDRAVSEVSAGDSLASRSVRIPTGDVGSCLTGEMAAIVWVRRG